MRVLVEHYLARGAALASPGVDELRWLQPVRPGDVLRVRVTVLEARRSRSKPDRGLVRTRIEALNQDGEVVMSMIAMNLFLCRDPGRPTRLTGPAASARRLTCRAAGSAPRRRRPHAAAPRSRRAPRPSARATGAPCP